MSISHVELGPCSSWSNSRLVDWVYNNMKTAKPIIYVPLRTICKDEPNVAKVDFTPREGPKVERLKTGIKI